MDIKKLCKGCGKVKVLDAFYELARMKDGHFGKCKECVKAMVLANREKNIDRIRAYDRDRAKFPHRMANARMQTKKWRHEDSRRMKCHNAVARALRNGTLQHRPCEWPGCTRNDSYAHHESYDKPLDVVFYCQPHHKERHKQMVIEGIES